MKKNNYSYFLLWMLWGLAIVYGSLIPFELRERSLEEAIDLFRDIQYLDLGIVSRADWIANILLYIPFAYLTAALVEQIIGNKLKILTIGISATLSILLAVGIEFIQLFFSPRTVSQNDLIAESIGTSLGLMIWFYGHQRLKKLFRDIFNPDQTALTAALVIYAIIYLFSSLFPFDFLISIAEFQWKIRENLDGWGFSECGNLAACSSQWLIEFAAAIPIGVLLTKLIFSIYLTPRSIKILLSLSIALALEAIHFFLASGVTTATSVITKTLGIYIGSHIQSLPTLPQIKRYARWIRTALLIGSPVYVVTLLLINDWFLKPWISLPAAQAKLEDIRFIPFYYHYFTSETEAAKSLLAQASSYLPLGVGYWLWYKTGRTPLLRASLVPLALITMIISIAIESGKFFIAGEHPDPTNIIIAVIAVCSAFLFGNWLINLNEKKENKTINAEPIKPAQSMHRILLISSLSIIVAISVITVFFFNTLNTSVESSSSKHEWLSPHKLPAVSLPNFKEKHPRLPAPSAQDINLLKIHNPGYISHHLRRAKGGEGAFESVIQMAFMEPESQDLNLLFTRLMELKFGWRGHIQGKPLAQAYDWLYYYWSKQQRTQLREKLVEGCNYLIEYIRKDKLSPYNVYLYNSPFQALMACSIALYKDDLRGDLVMAFTADMWKNRVIPLWRQVMGKNGGWHEGGEYVGIGIGQAIYQLPNMWRTATGEDFFKTESGIRGFLDFLIYRTRPDGTHFRWGDAGFFDRHVPDRLALAIEYSHKAAYSFKGKPKPYMPTSWPWGPLTNENYYDPNAVTKLPLTKFFDGIGMIVIRSDWSEEATYVTFKAGNNYWSHSHLDQGAFTIFKGAPLAIDSGLYGPKYGSDHHMNYTYQTIAHNTVLIHDPDDNIPVIGEDGKERNFANDGGQRRIGSGWGVDAAPLDVNEWKLKQDIYHTAEILHYEDNDDRIVVIADLTPAYTNRLSGKNSFSHRTRRVENLIRYFAYDKRNDYIVIYDEVESTSSEFRKRWLLHSIEEPIINKNNNYFTTFSKGSVVEGQILLPKYSYINIVGGNGFEFFVDDRNYDENGKVWQKTKQKQNKPEPGKWRIEVSPQNQSTNDEFLVILVPGVQKRGEIMTRIFNSNNNKSLAVRTPNGEVIWNIDEDIAKTLMGK